MVKYKWKKITLYVAVLNFLELYKTSLSVGLQIHVEIILHKMVIFDFIH